MIQIAGRVVERMQTHVGFGYQSRTGQDRERDDATMEVTPGGIYVKNKEGEWLVPYSNVLWAKLAEG